MRAPSIFLCISLFAFGSSACEGCDAGNADDPEPGASAEPEVATVDGYEIIEAPRVRGVQNSRPGEAQEARDREQLVREPTSPDPHEGAFSLQEAVDGLGTDGALIAEIRTDLGTIFCDLFADRVPNTVANFIGLARGRRAWWDAEAAAWVRRPVYSGTRIHRVQPGYIIQAGDPLDDGTGAIGYTLEDEPHETLRHDRAGQLCMADNGDQGRTSQFLITDGAARQLDDSSDYTVFGQCRPLQVIANIARVPQDADEGNRPHTPVIVDRVVIRRQAGGAAEARVTPPRPPPGFDPNRPARGASRGPSETSAFPGRAPDMVTLPEGFERGRREALREAAGE